MNDDLNIPNPSAASSPALPLVLESEPSRATPPGGLWLALAVLGVLCLVSLALAYRTEQRGASLEQELVRRQQEVGVNATDARALARQAQESVVAATAKVAVLDSRIAETAMQRGQLEDLIQSLSRSRDENLLVDVEAAIRVALQQNAITGSAEPLVATLKQADDRLARYNQPRLEGVRRAIARDLSRVNAIGVADIGSLAVKLDEVIRLVDELPLLGVADARAEAARTAMAAKPADAEASSASAPAAWAGRLGATWSAFGERVWGEARALVRVTRIEHPEAMLIAPDQAFFVRENLKLRLLNARLALLSRQFDTAQADLQAGQSALERYFDRSVKRAVLASELMRQVAGQARQVVVPRPDDTLAALVAASAGR